MRVMLCVVVLGALALIALVCLERLSPSVAPESASTVAASVAPGVTGRAGIAALYPGDIGIGHHPDVIFVEDFEEGALSGVSNRWTDVRNGHAMSLSADVPEGSAGSASLTIRWQGGGVNNGGHLYKQLSAGIADTIHVRYYIKYPANGAYKHSGVWIGGHNPPLSWPNPQAGVKPDGDDRFIAAAEQNTLTSRFDHYNYWVDMRRAVDGRYWGNLLLNDPDVQAKPERWTCVEQMVKLNNPVTASNGEHAIWLDGVRVSHVGRGFPRGSWSGGVFTQHRGGMPFEGIRWRNHPDLQLNWIWLQNYAPDDPPWFTGIMKFDQVVVAKAYIGCLRSHIAEEAK